MLNKIIISVLLVGVTAILVVGAINRTQTKAGNETGFWQEGEARIAQGGGQGREAGNSSQSLETPSANARGQGRGAGYWNNDQELSETGAWGEGPLQISELVELTGQVSSLDSPVLVINTASGETVEIANRAWTFAQEQGFVPQTGDTLTLIGFHETDGSLEVTRLENLVIGATLVLRDENGYPMWAGHVRRGS